MSTKNLPEDIVVEILLRLPVKSLVRFRCVSKRWRYLISDPRFAKCHFKQASERVQRVLLSTPSEIRSLHADAPFGNGLKELIVPFKQPGCTVRILGSCNGLVCVALCYLKDFYIWNPSTGDYKILPDPGISPIGEYAYGFGYDSSTNDYKLLVTAYFISVVHETKVFSLKTNSWKRIQNQPHCYSLDCYDSAGTLFNGALHWQVEVGDLFEEKIIAFDLADSKFREVPLPMDDDEDGEGIFFTALRNLRGRLCCICERHMDIELWGMMEYGVQESWATLFKVSLLQYGGSLAPLCFSSGDQLVAINDIKDLIRSNPEGEILERIKICSGLEWEVEACAFVESLLSPNDYNGDDGLFLLSDEEQRYLVHPNAM